MESIEMQPDATESIEVLWALISFLCLAPTKQLRILGYCDSDKNRFIPELAVVLNTIMDRDAGWKDEMAPLGPSMKAFFELIQDVAFGLDVGWVLNLKIWSNIRDSAKSALIEAGLDEWPLPQKLDVYELEG